MTFCANKPAFSYCFLPGRIVVLNVAFRSLGTLHFPLEAAAATGNDYGYNFESEQSPVCEE